MINIYGLFYVCRSLNFCFWFVNDGELIRYVFCRVLLSKSK